MKRSFSILALVLSLAGAFAQETDADWFWNKPISAIEWIGAVRSDHKELDATVRPYIGKPFTEELWSALQAQVYALDWFDSIEPAAYPGDPARSKVIVKFTVKEKPAITEIRIVGNSGLRSTEILDVVQEKTGDIYNAAKGRLDVLAVKRLYLDKGYPDATVDCSTSPSGSGLALVFTVEEGSLVTVKEIRFEGVTAFKEAVLRSKLELKAAGFLQPGTFQESKLASDRQVLTDYYRQRGYVDAAVVDVQRSLERDEAKNRNHLVLTFVVSEGKAWRFGGVSFEGNVVFPSSRLSSFFTQKVGAVMDLPRLEAEKQAMDDLYYENGYIFNTIDLQSSRDEEKGLINFEVHIVERDRAHIESISFKGNEKTKDYVLAREIPLQVGDIFSKARIIEGLRNLYNLQYFSSVQPELLPGSDENLMDLVINVEEQSTADIQFGFTLSGLGASADANTFPLSGLVKWNEKNLGGEGRTLGLELNASPTSQTATLSFGDNWIMGKRISGSVNLSFAHQFLTANQDILSPMFGSGVPDPDGSSTVSAAYKMPYEYWSLSFGASGGYAMNTAAGYLGMSTGLVSSLNLSEYDTTKYRPASSDLRETANKIQWTNKLPLKAYLNNLDLWYNPSSGYYVGETLTLAGFFPTVESQDYFRTDTKLEAYLTLFDVPVFEGWNFKWVLGGHSSLSAILAKGYKDESGNPVAKVNPADDVRLDGTFVGRGWTNLYSFDGGRVLWDNWLELRMPIVDRYIWMDGFVDLDVLQTDEGLLNVYGKTPVIESGKAFGDLGWENLVMSAGFGFRFTIQQFPFRFYFAKRFAFDGTKINWTPSGAPEGFDFVISIVQPLK